MELPALGQQCSEPDCKQLDFLPLRCTCGKLFCSEHFAAHADKCKIQPVTTEGKFKRFEGYKCSKSGCSSVSAVPLICEKCNKHFCITHRHIIECSRPDPGFLAAEKERYAIPVRKFNDAKAAVDEQLDKNIANARKKSKRSDTANKVQLMRIKNKASGLKTVPNIDRIYFNIRHPLTAKDFPIFISRVWTLGRGIDAVAQELKVENNNNKSDAKKLRLFKEDTGAVVSKNLADSFTFLLKENVIMEGETLLLVYVDNDCESLNTQ